MNRPSVTAYGAGRMGRGMAICFAYAGHKVTLVDSRARDDVPAYEAALDAELHQLLAMLQNLGMVPDGASDILRNRISYCPHDAAEAALADTQFLFEGVPETEAAKTAAFAMLDAHLPETAIIASTTSSFLADLVASWSRFPQRVLNAHFLNPAFLVPLVEVSPHAGTDQTVTDRLVALLEGAGKVPVICAASPGYIVPRIQALAMNEAARLVEEGVASAEDVDKAVRYGFGLRFAVLGLLEFIDWGGLDILYYASGYMQDAMKNDRFAAPDIIKAKMDAGETGMAVGKGMYDYEGHDIDAFRQKKLRQFTEMLIINDALRPPVLED